MPLSRLLTTPVAVTVTCTLAACTLTACTGGGTEPRTTQQAASGGPASPSGPVALTPEAYQQTLGSAADPVGSALGGIAKARNLKTLSTRVGRAEEAVADALEQLETVQPPPEIGTEHSDYVTALRGMDGKLEEVKGQIEGHSLCTSSAVLARLGKSTEFGDLKEAGADLAGGGDYPSGVIKVKTPKEQTRRLANGKILRSAIRGGRAKFTIKNGTSQDSVVVMKVGKRIAVSVYVRKKSNTTVFNIRDGSYRVYYTSGSDYESRSRGFTRNCSFTRFDDSLRFRTTRSGNQIRWTDWTIGLKAVKGGNAKSTEITPDEFPT